MENILDYLDNNFQDYWWILIIIISAVLFWLWQMIKNADLYSVCPRCGWELPEHRIYKDHCWGCEDKTEQKFRRLFGDDIVFTDTGYKPKEEKS